MCFWKRKEKQINYQKDKRTELEKAANNLKLLIKHEVTRFDETEAYVKALIELHPEVKEHPAILDLRRREEEYAKEKASEN